MRGENGYRYYSGAQYYEFVAVRMMVDAGLCLGEIASLRQGPRDALLDVLCQTKAGIEERMRHLEASRARLDAFIAQSQAEAAFVPHGPVIVERPEATVLVADFSGTGAELERCEGIALDAQALHLLASRAPGAECAPYGTISLEVPGPAMVYERCFWPCPADIDPGPFELRALPAGSWASLAFEGPWADIWQAHRQLIAFVEKNGADPMLPRCETVLSRLFDTGERPCRCLVEMPFVRL